MGGQKSGDDRDIKEKQAKWEAEEGGGGRPLINVRLGAKERKRERGGFCV